LALFSFRWIECLRPREDWRLVDMPQLTVSACARWFRQRSRELS
jgi:hypothetical protein